MGDLNEIASDIKLEYVADIASCIPNHDLCLKEGRAKRVRLRGKKRQSGKKYKHVCRDPYCTGIVLSNECRIYLYLKLARGMWYKKNILLFTSSNYYLDATPFISGILQRITSDEAPLEQDADLIRDLMRVLNFRNPGEIEFRYEELHFPDHLIYNRSLYKIITPRIVLSNEIDKNYILLKKRIQALMAILPDVRELPSIRIRTKKLIIEPNINFFIDTESLLTKADVHVGKYSVSKDVPQDNKISNTIDELLEQDRVIKDFIIQFSPSTENNPLEWQRIKKHIYFEKALISLIMGYLMEECKTPEAQRIAEGWLKSQYKFIEYTSRYDICDQYFLFTIENDIDLANRLSEGEFMYLISVVIIKQFV
jgi:hypothetical protein